jgi:uncharacterized delta-60 repeat protein
MTEVPVRTRRWILTGSTTLALLAASAAPATAVPGDLDPLFSGDGTAVISLGAASGSEEIDGLVVQPNGSLVGVGYRRAIAQSDDDLLVVRLTASGALDPTFSGNGWTTVELPGNARGKAVALQSDGKIVVVSDSETASDAKVAIVRLRPSGRLDPTFSGDGIRLVDLAGPAYPTALRVLSNDKILVAGGVEGADNEMLVFRLQPGGKLDGTFGKKGRRLIDFVGQNDWAHAIRVQADGKILLAGYAEASSDVGFGVVRLTQGGRLDGTFGGGDGRTRVNAVAPGDDFALGLTVLPGGSILMGGRAVTSNYGHAVVRVTASGAPDGAFGGGDGIVFHDPFASDDFVYRVIAQPDGKLVFAGGHDVAGIYEFEVARYATNGSVDSTFGGGDGVVVTPFDHYAIAYSAALTSSGKIVAAGRLNDAADDLALARYKVL